MGLARKATSLLCACTLVTGLMPAFAWAQPAKATTDDVPLTAQATTTQVTIGEGTDTNGYIGAYGSTFKRAGVETIYKADEIGTPGKITSVAFGIAEGGEGVDTTLKATSFRIYLGHTTKSAVSPDRTFDTEGLTLVYSYESTADDEFLTLGETPGLETFEFNENGGSFEYNGFDNLMVWIVRESANENSMLRAHCTATSDGAVGTLVRGNTGNTNAFITPDDVVGETLVSSSYAIALRPNIAFGMEDACMHANKVFIAKTAPTCTEEGYDVYYCPSCDQNLYSNPVAALGHDMKNGRVYPATCTTPQMQAASCSRCGESTWTETSPATGHDWDWDNATTTEDGAWLVASCKNGCKEKTSKSAKAADIWDGASISESWEGAGTEADPYKIASGADLALLAKNVNAGQAYAGTFFELTADVNLDGHEWTPVGDDNDHTFSGVFDGGLRKISNLKVTTKDPGMGSSKAAGAGLFGSLTGGTVKNVSVSGSIEGTLVTRTAYGAGGIVGCICKGENASVIENCRSEVNVSSASLNIGGIVGLMQLGTSNGTKANCRIVGCGFSGTLDNAATSGSCKAGGIIGYANSYAGIEMTGCYSLGSIKSKDIAGGLIGEISASSTATEGNPAIVISHCYTDTSLEKTDAYSLNQVGAYVGKTPTHATNPVIGTASRCYRSAELPRDFGVANDTRLRFTADDTCGTIDANLLTNLNSGLDIPAFKANPSDASHPLLAWEGASEGDVSGGEKLACNLSGEVKPLSMSIRDTANNDVKKYLEADESTVISYEGDGTVEVESSDESVATAAYDIASGRVRVFAEGPGEATITVSVATGNAYTASTESLEIPVAVLVEEFEGGSIRMPQDDSQGAADTASIRLGFTFELPTENTTWQWRCGAAGIDADELIVKGENYKDNGDGTITSNVVFTDIDKAFYDKELMAKLELVMTAADGMVYTWDNFGIQGRSVEQVATSIATSKKASKAEKAYARQLLGIGA